MKKNNEGRENNLQKIKNSKELEKELGSAYANKFLSLQPCTAGNSRASLKKQMVELTVILLKMLITFSIRHNLTYQILMMMD
jgi:hypothetical protein